MNTVPALASYWSLYERLNDCTTRAELDDCARKIAPEVEVLGKTDPTGVIILRNLVVYIRECIAKGWWSDMHAARAKPQVAA